GGDRRGRAAAREPVLRRLGAGEPRRRARPRGRGREARARPRDRARSRARRRRARTFRRRRDHDLRLDRSRDPGSRRRARGAGARRRAPRPAAHRAVGSAAGRARKGGRMAGRLVHFEVRAGDWERAKSFYGSLFGWKFSEWSGPVDYSLVDAGGEPGGALYPTTTGERGIVVYFGVDDMDAALAQVRGL